ncbi:MAG: hypothetical protein A3D53_02690 [Candidatus Magasanikbacteria bacterium RIFCSPHIGHO2_02_FULL_45_10]|nr:MAG: hypothetical protein A3D53_02690 [Candidatus Magasanikbacteria bacterium RIFCSPHIGHO2_02_FULL_45_10]
MQPYARFVKKEAASSVQMIARRIPVADVDIIIMHSPRNVAFGIISTQTQSKNHLVVALNVKHKRFKKNLRVELRKALAHGLYHIARMQKNGYPKTLIENCLNEGLAIHFEIEFAGPTRAPYWTSIKNEALDKVITKAKKECNSPDFDYDGWFYGSKTQNIPRFAGYCMGYKFIEEFLKNNPGATASKLVGKKSKFLLAGIIGRLSK